MAQKDFMMRTFLKHKSSGEEVRQLRGQSLVLILDTKLYDTILSGSYTPHDQVKNWTPLAASIFGSLVANTVLRNLEVGCPGPG
jgi:hypothetical protein